MQLRSGFLLAFALLSFADTNLRAAPTTGASEPPLVKLLERVRLSVPDAREISDVQVCPPRNINRDGTKFTVDVAFNRPHEARHYYLAQWKNDAFVRIDDIIYPSGPIAWNHNDDRFSITGIATRAMEKRMESCRWVSAAEMAAAWAALP